MSESDGRISPAEAHAKMTDEGFTYVDVRTPEEFAAGHPAGSINVPIGDTFVADISARFSNDAKIIVGCRTNVRSAKARALLTAAGFENVLLQRAGWEGARGQFGEILEPGWKRAGLPSE
jgi:rhodanese-related sulfurtransferase